MPPFNQDVTNARLEDHLTAQDEKIEKLTVAVDGNGKPGLKDRVKDLEACILPMKRFAWILIGALMVSAVSGAGSLIIALAKLAAKP